MSLSINDATTISNLSQFFLAQQQASPEKNPQMDDIMAKVLQQIQSGMQNNTNNTSIDQGLNGTASGNSDNSSPRDGSPVSDGIHDMNSMKMNKVDNWHECFTTTRAKEFEALIYSIYVIQRDDKKIDGYENYECINRLQNKCRYRVRARQLNEFYVVEEKGAHNHSMEPVGTPGTHAGLPKTLREIVDKAFFEEWPHHQRQDKLEAEVRRLGLPHNPRLGRQVDNRIAYLRRVKNLNEMKKMTDQVLPNSMSVQQQVQAITDPNQTTLQYLQKQQQLANDLAQTQIQPSVITNGSSEMMPTSTNDFMSLIASDPSRLLQQMMMMPEAQKLISSQNFGTIPTSTSMPSLVDEGATANSPVMMGQEMSASATSEESLEDKMDLREEVNQQAKIEESSCRSSPEERLNIDVDEE